ncbi:von Willebrand factor [Rubripirellula obstinata]|uniref:von Willebrand factor n=1 Tax=Rubripirellula obstinata TaxID=406547 RepID=A0A5B1CJ49_9BACT|nr:VWA domain-containing protein [Rubripirellula obstinata]KAA1259314.1 von Willebrand factor [Rubripirellula obstinata]
MSSENKSPWNDPRITAYVLDELPPDERVSFEKEMAADEALSQAVAGAGEVTGQLSALFKTETTPPLTDHRRAAIINEPATVRPEDEKTNRATVIAFLAIAATALALIGLSPMLKTQQVAQVDQVIASDRSADEMEVALSGSRIVLNESKPVDSKPESIAQIENQDKSQSISAGYAMAPPVPVMTQSEPQSEAFSKVQMSQSPNVKNVRRESLQEVKKAFQEDRARIGRQQRDIVEQTRIASTRAAEIRPAQSDFKFYITPRIIIQEEEQLAQTGFDPRSALGRGPGMAGDQFDPIVENNFIRTADHPLSTFSADVDTASYSKVRDFLMRANQMPRPDAVRIEEMVNYFDYDDAPPADNAEHPFAARVNITECPWNDGHRLARIAIKGKTMKPKERPNCNLVFLLDTSGSMNAANKLPLVVEGMKMLTGQLTKKDKVAIVVYAGSAGMVLDSTSAKKKKKIRRALENLSAGGSTNGGQGIALAYQTAREHFIEGGVNRVILCTDGDFNVGTTGTDSLVRMVEKEAKDDVYLTVLGFGMGNHNDAMLEQISGRGNGNYAFIDNQREAHKVLVKQTAGTLVTIAKDVKLQVDFNPAKVGAYRLIGYENRMLAKEDFNDDTKDAGEIGAGHSVTALYELVPPELADEVTKPAVDESEFTKNDDDEAAPVVESNKTLVVRIRYKQPESSKSTRVDFPAIDTDQSFADASVDTRFTAAVAGFGMLLRESKFSGDWELADVLKVAKSAIGDDQSELRAEFVQLVKKAKQLSGK